MRVLIISAALLACACAAPSYGHALVAPLAAALPTIPAGDIQGAAIDAHVDAIDHARSVHDQVAEIHGQQVNAAVDHSWQAFDTVKTAEAQLDGAAAGAAPVIAKSLVHSAPVAIAHAAPAIAYSAPVVAHAAPVAVAHAAPVAVAHAAPVVVAHAAPASHSYTVSQQSLSQTHPAPAVAVAHAAPVVAHAAPAVAYSAPAVAYSAPQTYSVSQQSLSQTHPSPAVHYSAPIAHAAW